MRLILIDNASGLIMGDTALMPRGHVIEGVPMWSREITPLLAARWLDEAVVHCYGRTYETVCRLASNETGYRVYRADVGGSDTVAAVADGTDEDVISDVEHHCEWLGCIRAVSRE